jgi:hypothetical protein
LMTLPVRFPPWRLRKKSMTSCISSIRSLGPLERLNGFPRLLSQKNQYLEWTPLEFGVQLGCWIQEVGKVSVSIWCFSSGRPPQFISKGMASKIRLESVST